MTATHIEVFYTDPDNGWCGMFVNADGCTDEPSIYCHHKRDAIAVAKKYGIPVHVFNKYGEYQRTLGSQT